MRRDGIFDSHYQETKAREDNLSSRLRIKTTFSSINSSPSDTRHLCNHEFCSRLANGRGSLVVGPVKVFTIVFVSDSLLISSEFFLSIIRRKTIYAPVSRRTSCPHKMTHTYPEALSKLLDAAKSQRISRPDNHENVSLHLAVGRTAARDILSPKSLPEHDTSAMDGYAVHAQTTASASPKSPVLLRVQGSVMAGDDPEVFNLGTGAADCCIEPCVEIMTGAIFPDPGPHGKVFDACVKLEDTVIAPPGVNHRRYILVTKPVAQGANKRFAGEDIREGTTIVKEGEVIRPSHILPLASAGIEAIAVARKPRVAVLSTGRELTNGNGATADANGPYLTAAVKDMGFDADFLGILDDDPGRLHGFLQTVAGSGEYDAVLTSGGVSKGRADHVPDVLIEAGAEVVFHGLPIRPGHPVLFALIPNKAGTIPVFGLPGNPGAAAACFRFLIVPYLRVLQGQELERPMRARLDRAEALNGNCRSGKTARAMDRFRHGVLLASETGQLTVRPSAEQSPAKLGPYIDANCWIHFTNDGPGSEGDIIDCYPLSLTGVSLSTNS